MKIYLYHGAKVWFDPETAPAEAIPLTKAKKPAPAKVEEPEQKAKPAPANKSKKATANKSRKAGTK